MKRRTFAERSASAIKGWETRRARAAAAEREAAELLKAVKATRRSDAAKKGWATRRLKERAAERAGVPTHGGKAYPHQIPDDFELPEDTEIELSVRYDP